MGRGVARGPPAGQQAVPTKCLDYPSWDYYVVTPEGRLLLVGNGWDDDAGLSAETDISRAIDVEFHGDMRLVSMEGHRQYLARFTHGVLEWIRPLAGRALDLSRRCSCEIFAGTIERENRAAGARRRLARKAARRAYGELIPAPSPTAPPVFPVALLTPAPTAARRVLEFFTAQITNDHTRKAYLNAARRFAGWCDEHGIGQLVGVQPVHVVAFIKQLQAGFEPPTVKQHMAALRMLFDWLVTSCVFRRS